MLIHIRCRTILLLAMLAVPLAAQADVSYAVKPIGVAGSMPAGINNRGEVVGYYTSGDAVRAFVYSSSGFVDLGTLGGGYSRAHGINDLSVVVGAAEDAAGNTRAFAYADGRMSDLGTLGGTNSSAAAINNNGQIAGVADSADGSFAFRFTPGAGMENLGTLPGGGNSRAEGINNAGIVVGGAVVSDTPTPPFHAFLFESGAMIDLDSQNSPFSVGQAINDSGDVVGWINAGFGIDHAFLYSDGTMTDLRTLSGFGTSLAYDINNNGQIVGWSEVAGRDSRGILYDDGVMVDLTAMLVPASGWTIQAAYGINDLQQIAAWGCQVNVCQALLLDPASPVPEPETHALLLAGLGLIGWTLSRKH